MNTVALDVITYRVIWYLLVCKLGQTNFKKSVELKLNIVQREGNVLAPETVDEIMFRSSMKALIGGKDILFR